MTLIGQNRCSFGYFMYTIVLDKDELSDVISAITLMLNITIFRKKTIYFVEKKYTKKSKLKHINIKLLIFIN